MPRAICAECLVDWNAWQVYILHDSPNNRQTRCLCREGVNLVRALSHIAKKTFNRIRGANITMHDWWKVVKGEKMLFIFAVGTPSRVVCNEFPSQSGVIEEIIQA